MSESPCGHPKLIGGGNDVRLMSYYGQNAPPSVFVEGIWEQGLQG